MEKLAWRFLSAKLEHSPHPPVELPISCAYHIEDQSPWMVNPQTRHMFLVSKIEMLIFGPHIKYSPVFVTPPILITNNNITMQ